MIKRLLGAITDGFGLEVGRRLVDSAEDQLDEVLAKSAAERKAKDRRAAEDARAAAKESARAAKLAERRKKDAAREVEAELAAMKRKLRKEVG